MIQFDDGREVFQRFHVLVRHGHGVNKVHGKFDVRLFAPLFVA